MRVLVIEDHRDVAESLRDFLEVRGWSVELAANAERGYELARAGGFDVFIVDLLLPGEMDGLEFCRRIRRESSQRIPVLMLTALDTLQDKLAGFESGTDDYLAKPFSLHEVFARLNALTARAKSGQSILEVGPLRLDLGQQRVTRDGRELNLSESGIKLLAELMRASPNVVDHERLSKVLWPHRSPDGDTLKTHIYYLRRELDRPFPTPMLRTVRGRGYQLVLP